MDMTITIPDEKVSRVTAAFLHMCPRPVGSQFSDSQWAKECVRRYVRDTVHRSEAKYAKDQATESLVVDDAIATYQ